MKYSAAREPFCHLSQAKVLLPHEVKAKPAQSCPEYACQRLQAEETMNSHQAIVEQSIQFISSQYPRVTFELLFA